MSFAANATKITAAYVQEFHDSFEIEMQQKESRLLKTVDNRGSITGNSFTINDMGVLDMQDRTRFGDTEWDLPDTGTRYVYLKDKALAVPIDKMDVPKLVAKVQGPYMNACLYAYQREVDKIIYNALLDPIARIDKYDGVSTQVTLPATQRISGTASLKDKIISAKAIFRANECDEQNGEKLYVLYNSTMLQEVLGDTTLTSADFMAVKMLQEGAVSTKWLGVEWIPYEDMRTNEGVTSTVMYTGSAVHYGQGSNYDVDIGPRRDKNNTIQIYVDASMAAGRANEQKVVELMF
ncbi:phage capsid protein [Orbaceae bacterium ESL0721]|nr:phage capsid protein [Orbaceae bacterium ESL0721]